MLAAARRRRKMIWKRLSMTRRRNMTVQRWTWSFLAQDMLMHNCKSFSFGQTLSWIIRCHAAVKQKAGACRNGGLKEIEMDKASQNCCFCLFNYYFSLHVVNLLSRQMTNIGITTAMLLKCLFQAINQPHQSHFNAYFRQLISYIKAILMPNLGN